MNLRLRSQVASLALVLAASPTFAAENWPQWRGPQSNGVAAEGNYPVEFAADKGYAWKIALPGLGMSTPAVWDDRIFVTCAIDGKDGVVAYNFEGKPVWQKAFANERAGKHKNASGSNPSPVTDGKHLVVYYKSGTLAGLDLEGNILWQKNVFDLYGKDTLWWDVGSSPVIVGNRVVIAVMQGPERGGKVNPEGSYLAAFELADGKPAWKTPRHYERPVESDNSYTTPMLLTVDGKQVIVTFGADHLTGHNPENGELLWDLDGFNPEDKPNWRVIASPGVSDSLMLIPFGRNNFLAGVRLGGPKPEKIWERAARDVGADVPSPIAIGERGYVLTDRGHVECLNLTTGKETWSGDLPRSQSKYYASPVYAGGKLYCTREDGVVYVVDVKEGFKQLSENNMGERIIATPVPLRGGLLVRGVEHLFWISGEAPKESQTAG